VQDAASADKAAAARSLAFFSALTGLRVEPVAAGGAQAAAGAAGALAGVYACATTAPLTGDGASARGRRARERAGGALAQPAA